MYVACEHDAMLRPVGLGLFDKLELRRHRMGTDDRQSRTVETSTSHSGGWGGCVTFPKAESGTQRKARQPMISDSTGLLNSKMQFWIAVGQRLAHASEAVARWRPSSLGFAAALLLPNVTWRRFPTLHPRALYRFPLARFVRGRPRRDRKIRNHRSAAAGG